MQIDTPSDHHPSERLMSRNADIPTSSSSSHSARGWHASPGLVRAKTTSTDPVDRASAHSSGLVRRLWSSPSLEVMQMRQHSLMVIDSRAVVASDGDSKDWAR
ncbi:hypothetical protein HYQ46_005551 [Verticillium longisporum]|nr:hypothetical protein HYQ46_005551 [Verticillium longisporum]